MKSQTGHPPGCNLLQEFALGAENLFAMLQDRRARRDEDVDAVVDYREPRGGSATAAAGGRSRNTANRTVLAYRDAGLAELDVAAVLDRHRELALINGLAHEDPPRSSNYTKRCARHRRAPRQRRSSTSIPTLDVANIESAAARWFPGSPAFACRTMPRHRSSARGVELIDLAPAALPAPLTERPG